MKGAILTFVRAVFWGSLSGGGPFLLLTVPLSLIYFEWARPQDSLWIAIMPIMISGAIVVPTALCVGLPLTAALAALTRENQAQYVFAGLMLGLLVPVAITLAWGGSAFGAWLSLPGALAGLVTAAVWGHWREEVASSPEDAAEA